MTATFAVGARFLCELSMPVDVAPGSVGAIDAVWTPDVPRNLSAKEWDHYRRGRDTFLRAVSARLGGAVLVAEV